MKNYLALFLVCSAFGCSEAPQRSTENEVDGGHKESNLHPLSGIYSIIDPGGGETTATTYRPVEEIIGKHLAAVEIEQRSGGAGSEATEEQLLELFRGKDKVAFSSPIWNIDWDVEIVGTLKYRNGTEGRFAIAGFRVGFQDQTGKPWYFEWEERDPSKNKP